MRAAVISLGSKSSQMTIEAMQKYFDQVDMIQLRDIEVNLGKEGLKFSYPIGHGLLLNCS